MHIKSVGPFGKNVASIRTPMGRGKIESILQVIRFLFCLSFFHDTVKRFLKGIKTEKCNRIAGLTLCARLQMKCGLMRKGAGHLADGLFKIFVKLVQLSATASEY